MRFAPIAFILLFAEVALAQQMAAPAPGRIVGPPAGPPLSGAVLEEESDRVAALLRCPVCQGLSVADSPAAMAVNMKKQVRDLVAAGYTEDQVLSYFEASYGEFVRLEPPMRGINWLVWLAPLFFLAAGVGVFARSIRRLSQKTPDVRASCARPNAPSGATNLEPYRAAVRDLVDRSKHDPQ